MDKQQTVTPPQQPAVAPSGQPRNFLAVMALATFGGGMGLNRIYTGEKGQGWTRFGLYVGGMLTSWIFIGYLPLLVASIWWIVDIFLVYNGHHVDAEGQSFVATERDKLGAKWLFIAAIVGIALAVVGVIISILFVVLFGLSLGAWSHTTSGSSFSTY